jgi:rhamnogalacturonan hydrolase
MVIRGGNEGGLDGIDIWGTNIWAHDIEVTNKDECVTVKSPASYILVENIFCNWYEHTHSLSARNTTVPSKTTC